MHSADRSSRTTRVLSAAVIAGALAGAADSARATLTLDVRASATQDNPSAVQVSANGKNVTIKSTTPGTIKLDVFAVVTGNTTGTTEGFGALFGGFDLAAGSAATSTKGTLTATVLPTLKDGQGNVTQVGYDAYPDAAARNGTAYVDANGFGHVGRDPSTLSAGQVASDSATGWFFAAYQNVNFLTGQVQAINTDGTPLPGDTGKEFKIGTLAFTPNTATIANGTNTVTLGAQRRTRTAMNVVPGVWLEDNGPLPTQVPFENIPGGTFNVGSLVNFDVALAAAAILGDVNNDSLVNAQDISPFVYALVNGATAFANQFPSGSYTNADITLDGLVNAQDISPFVARLIGLGSVPPAEMAALYAAVPEPSSFSIIILSVAAVVGRRRSR